MIVYGNIIYTIGSILVAAATTVRSFNFMIGGRIILALGDIATQIAQYKMFSSWFPPSNGFASTLGFELAVGKIGGFVGKSTANVIAKVSSRTLPFQCIYADGIEHRKLRMGLLDLCLHEPLHKRSYPRLLLFQQLLQQALQRPRGHWHQRDSDREEQEV